MNDEINRRLRIIIPKMKTEPTCVPDAELVDLIRLIDHPRALVIAELVSRRMKQLRLLSLAATFASMFIK